MHRIFRPVFALLAAGLFLIGGTSAPATSQAQGKPPFRLPFDGPPGPATWYLIQGYGNTISAFYQRDSTYRLGQGIHFGIDLAAPCGTPVLAIGDGVVSQVDGPHGAAPHNLMIDHPNGYASFYGHLLQRPNLRPGQPVKRGQPVALSGDPYGTCKAAPHLHLEIRNHSYTRGFNPIPLIDADWDSLALFGGGRGFEKDLADPRRWQFLDDQPDTQFGGPIINNYPDAWPPDFPAR